MSKENAGFGARALVKTLKLTKARENFIKKVDEVPRSKDVKPSGLISSKLTVDTMEVHDHKVWTVYPKNIDKLKDIHIIYLHGGAYIFEVNIAHWLYVKKLAMALRCSVSVIDYPLAPECSYDETIDMCVASYREIVMKEQGKQIIVMGDSAGGGLSLLLGQKLSEERISPKPSKYILYSPWVDLSMSNPLIDNYCDKDVILDKEALIRAGMSFSAGESLLSPKVSPLYGNLEVIDNVLLFCSDAELFKPDCNELYRKLMELNKHITLTCFVGMPHVWNLMPIKESKEVLLQTIEFISVNQ